MTPPAAWYRLTLAEAKVVSRDTAGLILPIGMPLLILVMNGLGADRTGVPGLGGLSEFEAILVPVTLAMVMAMIGVINMPSFLATYRKTGVLRRLAVTPASPMMVLVAQALVALVQTLLGVLIALGVGRFGFDLAGPGRPLAVVGALALGIVALFALGMVVAALAPTVNAAIAGGLVLCLGMLALAGTFGGTDALPGWLAAVGEHTPFGATSMILSQAWTGATLSSSYVAALGVTTVVSAAVAAATFRWE